GPGEEGRRRARARGGQRRARKEPLRRGRRRGLPFPATSGVRPRTCPLRPWSPPPVPFGRDRGQTPDRSLLAGAEGGLVAAAVAAGGEEKRQQGKRREHQCEPKAGHVSDTQKGHGRIRGHNASAVFSPSVENLVSQLTRLPGVGQRTAQRLAFHILQRPTDEALALAAALIEVKERVRFCRECGNLTEEATCAICLDARRDHATSCVVEQPVDVVSLERTHEYRGLYHVLGGALSPIDGVEPSDLRIDELVRRVDANGVREVVLATNPTMTG